MFPNNTGSDKYGSIGVVVPQAEVKVVDGEGRALPLGEKGELYYKGNNVMQGYLDNPEATKETMTPDGWLKTGDVAYIDKDGYIFLVDRIKELIKVKGYQVGFLLNHRVIFCCTHIFL
jgi:long-subunit acyl-CoA synthetase (AMP-forming)